MSNQPKNFFSQYRKWIIAGASAGILLLVAVSVGISLIFKNISRSEDKGQTIPVIIESGEETITQIGAPEMMEEEIYGSSIQLSEGQPEPQQVQSAPLATGVPLSEQEIQLILDRLPGLKGEPEDQVEFKLAQQPIPPPRPGETIQEPFPPAPPPLPPETVTAGPLEVLRYSPEGEIPLAPFVNITFNQPMVPLATLEDLSEADVPVKIEPSLPGAWRWLGTKTLSFQYDSKLIDRLPKATSYKVTIPAGTRSAIGGVLAETVEWTFTTPPAKVITTHPSGDAAPLEPLFFIAFDQRINPQAVLETIEVTVNGEPVKVRLATDEQIQADAQVKNLVKNTPEGRWLAFQATKPLPTDAGVTVNIGPGTPSAEGPLLTQEGQFYNFRTYAPLRIVEHGCSWYGDNCPPLTPFFIRFNNPIDTSQYQEAMLSISPALEGASVNIVGDTINIQGATKGRTTYTVTVSGTLQDIFGQTLGKDKQLTFRVGSAEPLLMGPDQLFVTVDPAASKPALSVFTINYSKLDVKIYAVQPKDWLQFKRYLREYQYTDKPIELPGKLVRDETMTVEAPKDTLTEVTIDLSRYLDGKSGQFIVTAAPPASLFQDKQQRFWQTIHAWVQVTQIGLDAFSDQSNLIAWATDLKDGTPLSGVEIEAEGSGKLAVTDDEGVARFPIPNNAQYLIARKGADQAMLPRSTYFWGDDSWNAWKPSDELRWYVFDDRQMYKPGEEMHVKGWLRRIGGGQAGDVGLVGSEVNVVSYGVTDPQGNSLGTGRAEVNALGGFDFVFTIPTETNLGYATLYLQAEGRLGGLASTQYYHSFQIQEFRRPEFEVSARNETTGPYFAGGSAVVVVEARYYAGGPLPNTDVTWTVTSSRSSYSPPNWDDFTFGAWRPWWSYEWDSGGESFQVGETFTGKTDASGAHYLRLDFNQNYGPHPISVMAEAAVMDVNRQVWASTTSLLVHPADLYVGMRSDRYFVERGAPLKIELIVTDLDGNPVADRPIEVRAARMEWKFSDGRWKEVEADVQTCTVGSQVKPVACTFETPLGGSYLITATISDSQGRKNQSQFTRWVSGGQLKPSRKVEQEQVTLIPDKETYQPGDVAHILVQAPFSPAEGLLTITRSGILYTQRFTIQEGSITLDVPIEERHIPNLNIQVDLTGSALRTDEQGEVVKGAPPRPAYASGQLNLRIPPLQRTLSLGVSAEPNELEPGGETTIQVVLQDANGKPVPDAELAVVVVDEAILALTNYEIADPMGVFYALRPSNLTSLYSRASILLIDPLALLQTAQGRRAMTDVVAEQEFALRAPAAGAPMATMTVSAESKMGEGAAAPIRVRTDFNPLAAFAPSVRTDAAGKASVTIKLPDNLTRYRVMVVAVDSQGKRFGSGESNLTARLPLMVRPSAPRFLNFGDQFELPVILQNQTDQPLEAQVIVQASNALLTGATGLRVTVPARDRVEVRFPARTDRAGTARFQIAAVSGDFADAATVSLPVYTPATTEAFAVYGVVDQGAIAQPIAPLDEVFPQFGGLEINTSSTALQALTDAVIYLVSYPFECAEQIASRVLAIAALRDVLTAFEAEGLPSPAEMEAAVQSDIKKLQAMQNYDGGFPYWRRGFDSIPFNTIHVAHALYRAESKGFEVPQDMKQNALTYLRQIESYYPSWYSQQTRWTLSAYALFVRKLLGDPDPEKGLRPLNEATLEKLSMEAVGWLWQVIQDAPNSSQALEAIRRHVNNRVVETAGAANFTTSYDEQTYLLLSSDRRTDAILLDALIADNPQSDLIPKLVNGLMAHRTRGRWGNTQENVFVLLALDRYFNTFEKQEPDFVARIWLGEDYVGEHEFRGRTTERRETNIPMSYLVDETLGGGTQNLILSKEGPGRLYYRLGLRYAPTDLRLDPLDMGFVVQRRYEAVDDSADVVQEANGTWRIRLGARVRVRVTMVADNRRYHVALVDPLPAGLEIINPALAVSGSVPQDPNSSEYRYGWWWWGTWYEHQNLRDERAEAFTALLWDGVYEYTYVARATTPGVFVAPPAKAEEMYSPEVFGRSGSDIVVVK